MDGGASSRLTSGEQLQATPSFPRFLPLFEAESRDSCFSCSAFALRPLASRSLASTRPERRNPLLAFASVRLVACLGDRMNAGLAGWLAGWSGSLIRQQLRSLPPSLLPDRPTRHRQDQQTDFFPTFLDKNRQRELSDFLESEQAKAKMQASIHTFVRPPFPPAYPFTLSSVVAHGKGDMGG